MQNTLPAAGLAGSVVPGTMNHGTSSSLTASGIATSVLLTATSAPGSIFNSHLGTSSSPYTSTSNTSDDTTPSNAPSGSSSQISLPLTFSTRISPSTDQTFATTFLTSTSTSSAVTYSSSNSPSPQESSVTTMTSEDLSEPPSSSYLLPLPSSSESLISLPPSYGFTSFSLTASFSYPTSAGNGYLQHTGLESSSDSTVASPASSYSDTSTDSATKSSSVTSTVVASSSDSTTILTSSPPITSSVSTSSSPDPYTSTNPDTSTRSSSLTSASSDISSPSAGSLTSTRTSSYAVSSTSSSQQSEPGSTQIASSGPPSSHFANPTSLFVSTSSTTSSQSPPAPSAYTSTFVYTSTYSGHGRTTTWTVVTTGVLSTQGVAGPHRGVSHSPGSIAGLTLGVLGALAFIVLWVFCARRRQRRLNALVHDAAELPYGGGNERGPLDDEIDGLPTVAPRAMEERYAGILLALRADSHPFDDQSREPSFARVSSPTLPIRSLPPPPPGVYPPPPSAYVPPGQFPGGARRRSSPGPDASAWLGGYSIAHSSGSKSYSASHPSEEPLLAGGVGSISSNVQGHGYNSALGSAFGSPEASLSGHGVLQSVSSHGELLRSSSHGSSSGGPYNSSSRGTSSLGLFSPSSQGMLSTLLSSGADKHHSIVSSPPASYKRRESRSSHGFLGGSGSERESGSGSGGSGDERSVGSVRAFFGRLRGGRGSPSGTASGHRSSNGGLEGPFLDESSGSFSRSLGPAPPFPGKGESEKGAAFESAEGVHGPHDPRYPQPRTPIYSFVLSNPDSQPPSPYTLPGNSIHDHTPSHSNANLALAHDRALHPPAWPWLPHIHDPNTSMPSNAWPMSPAVTDDSHHAEGLLDPRLRVGNEDGGEGGRSVASLRDFEDYSRPIGGLVNNRMYSATTFATQETQRSATTSPHGSLANLEEACVRS